MLSSGCCDGGLYKIASGSGGGTFADGEASPGSKNTCKVKNTTYNSKRHMLPVSVFIKWGRGVMHPRGTLRIAGGTWKKIKNKEKDIICKKDNKMLSFMLVSHPDFPSKTFQLPVIPICYMKHFTTAVECKVKDKIRSHS